MPLTVLTGILKNVCNGHKNNDVHYIECGTIDGVSWLHGLGYQPHVALHEDPLTLRRKMDDYGVKFSQLDAAYPISLPSASALGCHLYSQFHPLGLPGWLYAY